MPFFSIAARSAFATGSIYLRCVSSLLLLHRARKRTPYVSRGCPPEVTPAPLSRSYIYFILVREREMRETAAGKRSRINPAVIREYIRAIAIDRSIDLFVISFTVSDHTAVKRLRSSRDFINRNVVCYVSRLVKSQSPNCSLNLLCVEPIV